MSIAVFAAVLCAAALHATWNAVVKRAGDKLMTTILVAGASALVSALALPAFAAPAPASWPFLGLSLILQTLYLALLAATYRVADMGGTYPLMRGTAPLIVALSSGLWFAEPLSAQSWIGVGVICGGILFMAVDGRRTGGSAGTALALLNALVIAGYTITDGLGVRRSGAPVAYTLWLSVLTGLVMVGWGLRTHRGALLRYARGNWHFGLVGGLGTLVSYGVALWAMTLAPVALVAALRETSIIFGTIISGLVLNERVGPARIGAALAIATGAIALRLA